MNADHGINLGLLRRALEKRIERDLAVLNTLDGDPDPEPNLGATGVRILTYSYSNGGSAFVGATDQLDWDQSARVDLEPDADDTSAPEWTGKGTQQLHGVQLTSRPSDCRGFLRGFVSLPLIGGVTLIGEPTAAAVPVTIGLMTRYVAWLAREHAEALVEHTMVKHLHEPWLVKRQHEWIKPLFCWFPGVPIANVAVRATRPSTWAAAVLAVARVPMAMPHLKDL